MPSVLLKALTVFFIHCFRGYGVWMFEYDIFGLNSIDKGSLVHCVTHYSVLCIPMHILEYIVVLSY